HAVEVAAADDVAVVGEVGMRRPRELERHTVRDRAQPVVSERTRQLGPEPHVLELADRPRREAVAAGLLAREALLLDDQHPVPGPRQPVPRGRTRWSATDDERVPHHRCARRPAHSAHACALVTGTGLFTPASSRAEHLANPPTTGSNTTPRWAPRSDSVIGNRSTP